MKKIHKSLADKSSLEIAQTLSRAALENKAEDVVILDVQGISSFADYFVIMSGRSTRHVQGLADIIGQYVSKKRMTQGKVEGVTEGQWVLLDYNDVVVHIFYHESRDFYDLEGLWHDAPRVKVEE
ncbi:MAG: ribosome silencing factor [Deltaproteobacteria bacterium]|jgi:ribosome-associated protein|nr:ribosome silencing factor [Deltaproteobacteria bacterium]